MKALKTILTITLLSIFATSCSKPDDGAVGPKGETGTANVIYSDWATTPFTQPGTSWQAVIFEPKITQEIIDKGVILCYFKNPGNNNIFQLNYNSGSEYILYSCDIGKIRLFSSSNYSNLPFRYIIIPGGVSASGKMANTNQPDFKKMSYSEVCQQLHIPE